MTVVGEAHGLTPADLVAAGQGRWISEVRAVVATLTADLRCSSLAEVGCRLGREESRISSALRRLRERAVHDGALGERIEALREQLQQEVVGLQD